MLIDDSDADLLYSRIVIERAGIAREVLAFEFARDALAYLGGPSAHQVDLILLDINMPGMNGFEFLVEYERLCRDRREPAVVVMLTASPDPADRERAMTFGCVKGYVTKPIDLPAVRQLSDLVPS